MDKQTSKEFPNNIRIKNEEIISDGKIAKIYYKIKTVSKKRACNDGK